MELIGEKVYTAQDLFELLQQIPPAMRERLPVSISDGDTFGYDDVEVDAYETTETEGCIERGFVVRKSC